MPAAGQDVRLLSTKVADILAQFPGDSSAKRDKLAADILALGEPGIAEFAKKLVPAGTGNDTAVRFALNAVAVYASQAGEPKRALAERAFCAALGSASDTEVRTFLLSQLRPVGRDAAVKAASPLLADAALVEPATQLMLTREQRRRALRADGSARQRVGPRTDHDREGPRRDESRRGERPDPCAGRRPGRRDAQDGSGGAGAHREPEVVRDDDAGGGAGRVPVRARQRHRRV